MLINEFTSIRSTLINLVPYTKQHVPEYHEWMRDPAIQAATASEPLTLEEEYAMQERWRQEGDKLTFIVTKSREETKEGGVAMPRQPGFRGQGIEEAIGDVNLFISLKEADEGGPALGLENHSYVHSNITANNTGNDKTTEYTTNKTSLEGTASAAADVIVGELELMIAKSPHQGKGFGRAAILLFLWYILTYEGEILQEFMYFQERQRGQPSNGSATRPGKREVAVESDVDTGTKVQRRRKFDYFSVKIGKENERSVRLFEGLGFTKVEEEANWFGEFELRSRGFGREEVRVMLERWGIRGVEEGRFEARMGSGK